MNIYSKKEKKELLHTLSPLTAYVRKLTHLIYTTAITSLAILHIQHYKYIPQANIIQTK